VRGFYEKLILSEQIRKILERHQKEIMDEIAEFWNIM
jgi:hypothetical protein